MSKQAQNSMSAATDKGVLAYLDARVQSASNRVNGYEQAQAVGHALTVACRELHEAKEARATVAELIATGQRTRAALPVLMNLIIGMYGEESGGAAKAEMLIAEWDAALARCGSAQ